MNYFDFSSLILDNLEKNCEKLPVIDIWLNQFLHKEYHLLVNF